MMTTTDRPKTVAGRRQRIRQQLINLGIEPREADARASNAVMELASDQPGGVSG